MRHCSTLGARRRVTWARRQPVLYRFLLNKWYFDEVYDLIFVRTAKWIGTFLWKQPCGCCS